MYSLFDIDNRLVEYIYIVFANATTAMFDNSPDLVRNFARFIRDQEDEWLIGLDSFERASNDKFLTVLSARSKLPVDHRLYPTTGGCALDMEPVVAQVDLDPWSRESLNEIKALVESIGSQGKSDLLFSLPDDLIESFTLSFSNGTSLKVHPFKEFVGAARELLIGQKADYDYVFEDDRLSLTLRKKA